MPPATSHLSRPSIDHLYDLVQGLDENELQELLLEINSSAENNIEVAKAIDLFESPKHRRRESRPPCLDLSPGSPPPIPDWPKNRPITWRQSKRISSVPLNFSFSQQQQQHDPMPSPGRRISSVPLQLMHPQTEPMPAPQRERAISNPRLLESAPIDLPDLDEPLRPRTSNCERPSLTQSTSRSYRRISRPMFLAPGHSIPDLARQLTAYFMNEPIAESVASSTPGLSPTSPGSMSSASEFELGGGLSLDDLLEPATPRSRMIFGRPEREVPASMSGIFEVLGER